MFIIKKDHILTITELDSKIQRFYIKFLEKETNQSTSTRVDIKDQQGFLSTTKDARKVL